MEKTRVPKEDLIRDIRDVRKALDNILENVLEGSKTDYWLMTLMCRVGELELCLDNSGELKRNRLCTCYEKLGGDCYET